MGFDCRLAFADPTWCQANFARIADYVRGLPHLKTEIPPEEFRLKDDTIANSWPYDLRIFIRPQGIHIEASIASASLHRDVHELVAWLSRQTSVDLVDGDGVPVDLDPLNARIVSMSVSKVTSGEVQDALFTLIQAELINWSALEQIAFCLSDRGLVRFEIVEFFWNVMSRHEATLSTEDLDMLGDFNLHLIGQCNPTDIVRLVNDPEDSGALARTVATAMKGWTPPSAT